MNIPNIRYIARTGSAVTSLRLCCRIKPNVSSQREGIGQVTDSHIEVLVSSPAEKGKANEDVRRVIAAALSTQKYNVRILRGDKSRERTIQVILNDECSPSAETAVEQALKKLRDAATSNPLKA